MATKEKRPGGQAGALTDSYRNANNGIQYTPSDGARKRAKQQIARIVAARRRA